MIKNKILNLFSIKLNSNSYERSLFIRKLYYKLAPFILSIFFITIFFWPSIYNIYDKEKKPALESPKKQNKFTFQGIDEFNQPFFLHAKKYQKIINNENKLLFEKPKAEINLREGKWLTMVAKEGIFDMEKQTLELMGDVLLLHSDGQQIDTNNAVIDLKKSKIYGNKRIFGKSETINFSSDGFEVKKTGKIFQLLGKSKIKIKNTKWFFPQAPYKISDTEYSWSFQHSDQSWEYKEPIYLLKFLSNNFISKPCLIYSALSLSQVSIEVNNLNSLTFFSSIIGFNLSINLSKSFGFAPRFEFIFNSRFGIGFLLISSNNL